MDTSILGWFPETRQGAEWNQTPRSTKVSAGLFPIRRQSGRLLLDQQIWRTNEMGSRTEQRHNLPEPRTVSREGFRIKTAAGVAIANCLNEGVHLTSVYSNL